MTLQPDEPGRPGQDRRDGRGGRSADRPGGHPQPYDREVPGHPDGTALHPTSPGGTTEPVWVLAAIVLGLLALTGSLVLWISVGVAGLLLWMATAPPTDPPEGGRDPFGHPLGGPFGGGGMVR